MKIILSSTDLNQVITNYIRSFGLNTNNINVEFINNEAIIELNPTEVQDTVESNEPTQELPEVSEPLFG